MTAGAVSVAVHGAGVRLPLGRARVAALARAVLAAERARSAALSFTFVTRRAIAALNRRHLGHAGATDVITFRLAPAPGAEHQADVYICPDVARDNAAAHGCGVREEVARLVVHGTLHAVGHDHPDDRGRTASPMWRRQERLLARFLAVREAA